VTNTLVTIKLQGGRAGNYDLVVNRKSWGDSYPALSTTDDFALKTVIIGSSPKVGSIGGGTLLTVTGENFDTIPGNTLVIIGNVPNWICEVASITAT
jgi:IPT/TIG domain